MKSCLQTQDHPRACGEKVLTRLFAPSRGGSPPRMRGKVIRIYSPENKERITPAHAGKRTAVLLSKNAYWDHPRVCGEKCHSLAFWLSFSGSPPRMRGKAQSQLSAGPGTRITPAYAGKSFAEALRSTQGKDHPRTCGEKLGSHDYCCR